MYDRSWGGIPFIYSFGDCSQLPPVKMKSIFDISNSRTCTSDHLGKMAFHDFITDSEDHDSMSIIVLMEEVLRQENQEFLWFLDNMRNGCLNDNDVRFIISRCYDKLSDQEKNDFQNTIIQSVTFVTYSPKLHVAS